MIWWLSHGVGTLKRFRVPACLPVQRSHAPSTDTAGIAHAHDGSGKPIALPCGWQSFPELAPLRALDVSA